MVPYDPDMASLPFQRSLDLNFQPLLFGMTRDECMNTSFCSNIVRQSWPCPALPCHALPLPDARQLTDRPRAPNPHGADHKPQRVEQQGEAVGGGCTSTCYRALIFPEYQTAKRNGGRVHDKLPWACARHSTCLHENLGQRSRHCRARVVVQPAGQEEELGAQDVAGDVQRGREAE